MDHVLQGLLSQIAQLISGVVLHDAAGVNQPLVSDRPGEILVPAEMEIGVGLALDDLLTVTVDECLNSGFELTELEHEARRKALRTIARANPSQYF